MGNESHDFLPELGDQGGPQPGPSWANKAWPLTGADAESDWTQALDPTAMAVAVKAAAEKAGKATDPKAIEQAAADSIRAMLLIRLYRVRGHLAAELDPLGISNRELPEDLQLASHGFAGQEDREVYVGGLMGRDWVNICTSPMWRNAASSRSGSKDPKRSSSSRPRASARSSPP